MQTRSRKLRGRSLDKTYDNNPFNSKQLVPKIQLKKIDGHNLTKLNNSETNFNTINDFT